VVALLNPTAPPRTWESAYTVNSVRIASVVHRRESQTAHPPSSTYQTPRRLAQSSSISTASRTRTPNSADRAIPEPAMDSSEKLTQGSCAE
jgi:hypothetical protein